MMFKKMPCALLDVPMTLQILAVYATMLPTREIMKSNYHTMMKQRKGQRRKNIRMSQVVLLLFIRTYILTKNLHFILMSKYIEQMS